MAGTPIELFELEIAPLDPHQGQGVPGSSIMPLIKDLWEPSRWQALSNQTAVVPLGLRWRLTPKLGLPRTGFTVFRRDRGLETGPDFNFDQTQTSHLKVGTATYKLPTDPAYQLLITAKNTDPVKPLIVRALDLHNDEIPLQFVSVPPGITRVIRFQHPFIGGFKCEGNAFQITRVMGVTMTAFAKLPNWEQIEIVGLPAASGEIGGYSAAPQGYPTQPAEPASAAKARLAIAKAFYRDLAVTLPNGVNLPHWDVPTVGEAIDEVREGSPSLIERIDEMLKAVDSGLVSNQADFRSEIEMPGIHQPDFPGQGTSDATASVPILATFLLNAVTDSWFALASGFGTSDFPSCPPPSERYLEPASYFNVDHDYMVSAKFRFRLFGFEFSAEHFALSHRSAYPQLTAEPLAASVFALDRPPHRDDRWSIDAAVTWPKSNRLQIQGNAIAVAEDGLNGTYLNALRPATTPSKPALFVPAKPGESSDPQLATINRFIHNRTGLPFSGTRINHYAVATMDAFGRWSEWRTCDLELRARQPESPRLVGLSLTPDLLALSGRTVPHRLEAEIIWDWQDRSPKRFELAGVFHRRVYFPDGTKDNGQIPPTDYPTAFQRDNSVATGPLLEITFASDSPPGTPPLFDSVPAGAEPGMTIELLPQSVDSNGQIVEGEMRRYRISIPDISVTFLPEEEWFFTLFVKAAEWRNPALLSDSTAPMMPGRPPHLTAYIPNPIPPPPPVFAPAEILWTALPDAAGTARYRVHFDRIDAATGGYAVFLAHEAKLRDLADLPVRGDSDLIGRATDLRDLVMPVGKCIDAFSRLNARLIPPPAVGQKVEFEVELSGTLDGLVAIAVRAVSREQIESSLSTPWLFVGVPRMNIPATPTISLAGSNGNAVLRCDLSKSPPAASVEILRARREFSAREPGTMGPPIHECGPSEWEPTDENGESVNNGVEASRFRFTFADQTPPSWFPYFYRAVATGAVDERNGFRSGRSMASNIIKFENLPNTPPVFEGLAADKGPAQTVQIHFRTDAPVVPTSHGSFKFQALAWDAGALSFKESPDVDLYVPTGAPVPAGGTLIPGKLYFSAPDLQGKRDFRILIGLAGTDYFFKVRLIDPVERISEGIVKGSLVVAAAPNLSNLDAGRLVRDLRITFESTTPVTHQSIGQYMLEATFLPTVGGIQLLFRTALDLIPVGNLLTLSLAHSTRVMRDVSSTHPFRYGAIIKSFYPSFGARPGRLRLRLSAPDGNETVVQRNLSF